MPEPILHVENLVKRYDDFVAVNGISFSVEPGQVFCLLGPNGAGKTTTVECTIGLKEPDGGSVSILGHSPHKQRTRVFEQVGVQFQENSLYPLIKPREAIRTFASMYENPMPEDELLQSFGLAKRTDVQFRRLSGGEKRKLLIAIALVGRPKLLFLDEPSSGLDPHARRNLWHTLRPYQERGLTIFMTTHNMQEAEQQSDVVCLMEQGQIIASGSPAALMTKHKLDTRIRAVFNGTQPDLQCFRQIPGFFRIECIDHSLYIYGQGVDFEATSIRMLHNQGIREYAIRTANLEDLYLLLTGAQYQET